jgi:hypothetical protein
VFQLKDGDPLAIASFAIGDLSAQYLRDCGWWQITVESKTFRFEVFPSAPSLQKRPGRQVLCGEHKSVVKLRPEISR